MSPSHFCLSAAKNLSSFQLLAASLIIDLLQLFFGLPLFLFPWGFQSRAVFGISSSSFLNVWPIYLNFLFLISKFISSCPVTFHRSLLEIMFGHHILHKYRRHLFTNVCILLWISFLTSQVSHPYKSTDFTKALNILILVSLRNDFYIYYTIVIILGSIMWLAIISWNRCSLIRNETLPKRRSFTDTVDLSPLLHVTAILQQYYHYSDKIYPLRSHYGYMFRP